jgi:protein tyrosine phosphatase
MHNQYLNWPDCGLPKKRGAFIEFLNMMIQEESFDEPIVVHCSAGVGRTGTFIALSHIIQIVGIQKDMKIDIGISVFSIVRRLREQRMCMVETIEQFEFLYDFVCEIVDTHG